MTIDEAIKHCEEVAEKQERKAKGRWIDNSEGRKRQQECIECAADHRQLAEWLRELKEAKRLLRQALEDMNGNNICYDINPCNVCTENQKCPCDTFKWRYTDEAEKLLDDEI